MSDRPAPAAALLRMVNVSMADWRAVVIAERRQVIGGAADADIFVGAFERLSPRHAEIWLDRGLVKLRDLGSSAGTRVNRLWLGSGREATVYGGDRIHLADLELEVLQVPLEAGRQDDGAALDGWAARNYGARDAARQAAGRLTAAELEVVLCFCRGEFDDAAIGRWLQRSPNTVRTQTGSIFRKLNLHSRAEVAGYFQRRSGRQDSVVAELARVWLARELPLAVAGRRPNSGEFGYETKNVPAQLRGRSRERLAGDAGPAGYLMLMQTSCSVPSSRQARIK